MQVQMPDLAIPHLKPIAVIGQGSMAVVYVVVDERLKVQRAVKVLARHLLNSEQIRVRFGQEAQTMAALNHPNVVSVLDVNLDKDPPCIVMEYLPGGSLRGRVDDEGGIAPRIACSAIFDVLDALDAAHAAGILHRDIKPENLLITQHGSVKVSDFGIAHVNDADHSFTKTGAVLGTAGFMSPEQQRSAKGLTAQSDLYSVGATLYAIITGDKPVGLHVRQAREAALESIPEALHAWLTKACALDPADRFENAATMKGELESACAELPEDPEDAKPLLVLQPEREDADSGQDGEGFGSATLFGRYEGAAKEGNAQFQTEWTEDKGKKPLLIAIAIGVLVSVAAVLWYGLPNG